MADGAVRVEGARELRRTLKAAGQDVQDLKDAHAGAGSIVIGAARPPHRSGRLAASQRAGATATAATVRAGRKSVPYAQVIHWGWGKRHIAANPWLSRAARDTEPAWTRLYEDAVERVLHRIRGA